MGIETEGPRTKEECLTVAKTAIAEIEKDHGAGAIFSMADGVGITWPHIPTGMHNVDTEVLGIGGIPRSRITEVYGPESGGKTTLVLQTMAAAQAEGGLCAFIDAEHALDPTWANKLGVNVDELYVSQPDSGDQALQIAQTLVESGAFAIIAIDSVAALVPKKELEGDIGDSNIGLQARLMSQSLRMLKAKVNKSGCSLIFINQIRMKIGVMFGSPETTPGGRALKFYADVRLDVRRISSIKKGEVIIGNEVRIKAAKNKMAPPFKESRVNLLFDRGFDTLGALAEAAIQYGIITKKGSWFSYDSEKLGQGKDSVVSFLEIEANRNEIKEKIKACPKLSKKI